MSLCHSERNIMKRRILIERDFSTKPVLSEVEVLEMTII